MGKPLHTPGHTPGSVSYFVNGLLFSGDTLFLGDVGRPDLAQNGADLTQEDLAGYLYESLRNKIMPLPDDVIVYPAHGAGSACGKNLSKETVDTLGNQKKTNYALRADMTKQEFVDEAPHRKMSIATSISAAGQASEYTHDVVRDSHSLRPTAKLRSKYGRRSH